MRGEFVKSRARIEGQVGEQERRQDAEPQLLSTRRPHRTDPYPLTRTHFGKIYSIPVSM